MLKFIKKNTRINSRRIVSPIAGEYITISQVKDEVFSSKVMGDGFAIIPEGNLVVAPADGEIAMLSDSKHAFVLVTNEDIKILVHIGLDTVKMAGNGFESFVCVGRHVKAGQPIISFDRTLMEKENLDLTTIVIFLEGYNQEIKPFEGMGFYKAGQQVLA